MKTAKNDSPIEVALQHVETLMHQYGLKIEHNGCSGLVVSCKDMPDMSFEIRDTDNGSYGFELPRMLESEKLVLQHS